NCRSRPPFLEGAVRFWIAVGTIVTAAACPLHTTSSRFAVLERAILVRGLSMHAGAPFVHLTAGRAAHPKRDAREAFEETHSVLGPVEIGVPVALKRICQPPATPSVVGQTSAVRWPARICASKAWLRHDRA